MVRLRALQTEETTKTKRYNRGFLGEPVCSSKTLQFKNAFLLGKGKGSVLVGSENDQGLLSLILQLCWSLEGIHRVDYYTQICTLQT